MRETENKLFHMTVLWWAVLFVMSMTVMLYVAQHKALAAEQGKSADAQANRDYRMCVVIDPLLPEAQEPDGETENTEETAETAYDDVTLAVAQRVASALADSDIRVRLTRSGMSELTDENKLALIEKSGADYYISLGVNSSSEPETYGISGIYNAEFFIPKFGNAELTDLLVRNVTVAASDRAIGVYAAETGDILMELSVPSARVNLGYVTNDMEYALMRQDDYQDKLAAGITDTLMELLEEQTE